MNQPVATFPKSVQPGIPKLGHAPSEWTRYKIGELFDVVSRPVTMEDDVEYNLVTVKRNRGGIAFRERTCGKNIAVKSQFIIREGDFLISKRQIVHGACGIVSREFDGSIVSNEYAVLRPKSMLLIEYLGYLVHSVYMQQTFFHASIGVHVEKLIFKLNDWFKWSIHLPPREEQQEVIDAVSATEDKVDILRAQRLELEKFKKEFVRKIFSQEIRFKQTDREPFPDWQIRKLADIGRFYKGKGISKDDVKVNGVTPCIRYGEIYTHYNERIFDVVSSTDISPRDLFMSKAGDVIIPASGEDRMDMARACCVEKDNVALGGDINVLRSSERGAFLSYYLNNARKGEIAKLCQGISVVHLYASQLKKVTVEIPTLAEQERIVSALTKLDVKIRSLSDQIVHMEAFKKGLLQKLFV